MGTVRRNPNDYIVAEGKGTQSDPLIPVYADYYWAVGEGDVPNRSYVHKFGRNPDIDTVSGFETIWSRGGDYTGFDATAGEAVSVSSSSANDAGTLVSSGTATGGSTTTLEDTGATFVTDGVAAGDVILNDTDISHGVVTAVTSETILTVARFDKSGTFEGIVEVGDSYRVATAASTGAAVIELGYLLDSNFANETNEFIILNGITAVDTVGTDYLRCSRAEVIIAGSNGSNVGTLTGTQKVTTANVLIEIPIGYNQTMQAVYTIPSDKEGHLVFWIPTLAGKVNADCNVRLMIRHRGEVFRVEEEVAITSSGSSALPRSFLVPKNKLSPGSDIKIVADTDTNDTAVAASFDIILSAHE